MTWPRTMAELVNVTLMAVRVAEGCVYIGLALFFVAYVWWVFRVRRNPEWTVLDAIRIVLIVALLAVFGLSFIPLVRWIRQLTS
jgi:hypothetical protein